jgi:60 kDa SS-A/Ro ribonucleoprotein
MKMVRKTQSLRNRARMGGYQGTFKKEAYKEADHLNKEGAPSFSQPIEIQATQNLLCNIVEPSFYTGTQKLLEQSHTIYQQMSDKGAELFAKMVIYARNEGYMRLQPLLGLVYLSKKFTYDFFAKIFNRVVRTPKDLMDFINLCKSGTPRRGLGRKIKRTINQWLKTKVSQYWAIKYPKELRIASKLSHLPLLEEVNKQNIFDYLHDWNLGDGTGLYEGKTHVIHQVNDQLRIFEALKECEDDPAIILRLINKGRLPHEAVTGVVEPQKNGWTALMYQMPYFALLRHLATLAREGVFTNSEHVEYVYKKLTSQEAIDKVKVLPFRFWEAKQALKGGRVIKSLYYGSQYHFTTNKKILDPKMVPVRINSALDLALENSFNNMPSLREWKVLIGTDVSGSMNAYPEFEKNRMKKNPNYTPSYAYVDIAGIFTGALYHANPTKTIVIPFDTVSHPFVPNEYNTIMEITEWFSNLAGGGTDLGIPIKEAIKHNINVDVFIGITDSEDWARQGVAYDLQRYRELVNPTLRAFLLRIDPYTRDSAINLRHPLNTVLSGWSDKIPKLIPLMLKGQSQLDVISQIEL